MLETKLRSLGRGWTLAILAAGLLLILGIFRYLDLPIAEAVAPLSVRSDGLATGLAGPVIVSGETVVALSVMGYRIARGSVPTFWLVLAVACLSSICAYGLDDVILKTLFGVPTPADVLRGVPHRMNLGEGSHMSSFPSGHMALAGGFAGVFMFRCPSIRRIFSALLAVAGLALILGTWHFLSDVLAGALVGLAGGWGGHLVLKRYQESARDARVRDGP